MQPFRRLVSAAILAASVAAPVLAADYKALTPLLADLPGWQAEAATGMNMDMNGQTMVTAERSYDKGEDKHVQASILVGQAAAMGLPAAGGESMRIETEEGVLEVLKMDGFTVTKQHDKAEGGSGAIVVHLGPTALFAVNYDGLSADEGLSLAKRFDWRKLQAAAK